MCFFCGYCVVIVIVLVRGVVLGVVHVLFLCCLVLVWYLFGSCVVLDWFVVGSWFVLV